MHSNQNHQPPGQPQLQDLQQDITQQVPPKEEEEEEEEAQQEQAMGQAKKRVTKHIRLLHQYNSIRDIGTGLMGLIAERKGERMVDVYQEFGVDVRD